MRALKALVIGMGVLIVVGTVVVAVKMFQLASGLDGSAGSGSGGAAGGGDGFGTLGLGMAASCEVADAVATGDGLVLRYAGPARDGCDVLHVVDPDGGRLVGTIAPHADARRGEGEGEPR